MGEQRNLTEENVTELKEHLERMQKDNPDLEYRFYKQQEERTLNKLYIGTKLIRAFFRDECSFLSAIKGEDVTNRETREGYQVTYPDGYVSWSPKKTFESAYREVTDAERDLL